jgi:hypothetical protein
MRSILSKGIVCACAVLAVGTFPARATLEVSAAVSIHARADFYAPLTPHGAWIEVGSYGHCWRPAQVAVGWRPYCEGSWVWTDCGWYWESYEPWAWACYHYGSWVYDPAFGGWFWVPDIEWAPAWVTWRVGGGYCGWAPYGPHGVVVAAPLFVFVSEQHFHEPIHPRNVVVNNTTIINHTTVVNNLRPETRTIEGNPRRVMVNEGPGVERFAKASRETIRPVPVHEAVQRTPVPPAVTRQAAPSNPKQKESGNDAVKETPVANQPGRVPPGQERKEQPDRKPDGPDSPGRVAPEPPPPNDGAPPPSPRPPAKPPRVRPPQPPPKQSDDKR